MIRGHIGNFDPSGRSLSHLYPDGASGILAQSSWPARNACDPGCVTNTNGEVVTGAPCMQVVPNRAVGLPTGLRKARSCASCLAWALLIRLTDGSRWVVRGGYGMYNVAILGATFHAMTATIQGYSIQYVNRQCGDPSANVQCRRSMRRGTSGCATCYGQDEFLEGNTINWQTLYHSSSLLLDHDFGAGYALRASYIGSLTRQSGVESRT